MSSPLPTQPRWRAAHGCPDHLRYTIEKTVNGFPPAWLEEPVTGEVFESMELGQERLVAYSFSQGFDVVVVHSTKRPQPVSTFGCIHHDDKTKNWRRLPDHVERDEEGTIIGRR